MKTVKMFGKTIAPKAILAILLSTVLAGTAFAAYLVWKQEFTVTVKESIIVHQEEYEGMGLEPPSVMGPWDAWCGRWFIENTGNALLITMKIYGDGPYIKSGITVVESNAEHTWGGYIYDTQEITLPYECSFVIGTNVYTEGEIYNRGAHWGDYFTDPITIVDPSCWVMVEAGFYVEGDAPADYTIDWTIEFLRS